MTLSKYCLQYKVTAGTVVARSQVSRQTLQNWLNNKKKQALLELLVIGVVRKIELEQEAESK